MAGVTFTGGEVPTAAKLNQLATTLRNVETATGGYTLGVGATGSFGPGSKWTFQRSKRYLITLSSGSIIDPSGLSEPKNVGMDGWAAYDLNNLGWLKTGQLYFVEGVTFALEADSA